MRIGQNLRFRTSLIGASPYNLGKYWDFLDRENSYLHRKKPTMYQIKNLFVRILVKRVDVKYIYNDIKDTLL